MSDETYVNHAGWRQRPGRPDHVDEVADQFERPAEPGTDSPREPGRLVGVSR